jgi:putative nucleotidyltransferase with HDIG domain
VAHTLGCREEEIQDIRWGALLHDIGKIGVPDGILRKPGALTDEEWGTMRQHPVIGEQILLPVERMQGVARIVRHHHEKWDGTGYPDGLRGEAIPLGARILAAVDAYGAITDERPYKQARSHEDGIHELRRCAGQQFDPEIVDAFCRVLERTRAHVPSA